MPWFGFRLAMGSILALASTLGDVSIPYGALSRAQPGAGIDAGGATSIVSGNDAGHWQLSAGRIYPTAAGVTAQLDQGNYTLVLNDDQRIPIKIEPETWEVTDQSEWDFVATQSSATLAGKTIALRNGATEIQTGITGGAGTPFRNAVYEDGEGNPCTVKGRFGLDLATDKENYCLIDKLGQEMRGARGVKFEHLRTSQVAEEKLRCISQSSGGNISRDITIDDCWISGAVGDPNGDYSDGVSYPNFGINLISTGGKTAPQGSITISNCLIEWGGVLASCAVEGASNAFTFTNNECRYFYGDAVQGVNFANEQAADFICTGNFIHSCVGRADDTANSHADSIRVQGSTTAQGDYTVLIEDNVILPGDARGDAQGIFLDDMKSGGTDSGFFFSGNVRNNIVQVRDTGHGVTVGQLKNMTVRGNTAVGTNEPHTIIVFIATSSGGGGQGTSGGGNVIEDNICEVVTSNGAATETNNFELGLAGVDIDYSAAFAGPGVDPWLQTGTADDAKAVFLPKFAAGAIFGQQVNAAPTIFNFAITGTAQDGETLTATSQASGIPAASMSYKWQVNGSDIPGEISSTLLIDAAAMGIAADDPISCEITATNSEGSATVEPSIAFVDLPPTPTQTLVNGATRGYIADDGTMPNTENMVLEFKGWMKFPTGSIANGQRLMGIVGGEAEVLFSGTRLLVGVEDSNFTPKMLTATVGQSGDSGLDITLDQLHYIEFKVEWSAAASQATLKLDGETSVMAFEQTSSGFPQAGAKPAIGGLSNGSFLLGESVEFADLDILYNGVSQIPPSGGPLSNVAATANGNDWKLGGAWTQGTV